MANTLDEQTGKASSWLKLIPSIRDGVLVVAGILYVLGYLVWAINAHQNNLGPLPALEFQYFIAGIAPALLIPVVCSAIIGMKLLRDKLQVWLGPGVTGWKLVLGHTISASLWLSMVGILVSELYISENVSPVLGERVSIVCAVAMMMSFYLRPPWEEEETEEILDLSNGLRTFYSKFVRGARTLFTVWIVLLGIYVSEIGLRFFVEEVYSNIPQEFGGAQPRCARLDVVTDQLSVETRKAILSIDSINSESQVVQTIEVNVFFSGSEFMLVKPLTQEQEPKSEVYEIRRSVIQAVTWCSQRDR